MTTRIIGVCDPHFTNRKPGSRRDSDWKETQERKLGFVFETARTGDAIVVAGDWFHQPEGERIPRTVDTWLTPVLKKSPVPLLGIPGNHDMASHRIISLDNHPYGVLRVNRVFTEVCWPSYVVIGNDPPVIVTGYPYKPRGPLSWIKQLRDTQALVQLKDQVSEQHGKGAWALAMTHCFWGPKTGLAWGEPMVGHDELETTGIDLMLYGHPHTDDGVVQVGTSVISGPGSLFRGSLAEKDTKREPKILVASFSSDSRPTYQHITVPHRPSEEVFDLEKHEREKRHVRVKDRFVQALSRTQTEGRDWEEILSEILTQKEVDPVVVSRTRQFITSAEEILK